MLRYNVKIDGKAITVNGKPAEYNKPEAKRIAKQVDGEIIRSDGGTEDRRMYRMTDEDVAMLDKIAGYYFVTADRNRSAALRLIVRAEFAKIEEIRRKQSESGTQPSYVAPPTFGKA